MWDRSDRVFHDTAKGERPIVRSTNALYSAGSPIWRVHGDVTSMMVGGIAALLLQMLHPLALAGVWEHSRFRDDMLGRLRRTARFIAVTTYADKQKALALIERINAVHDQISGTTKSGKRYAASDPQLLAWIHACETWCFLEAWKRFGEPAMSETDQDTYVFEAAQVARLLRAAPVPSTHTALGNLIDAARPELTVDARTREVAQLILKPAPYSVMMLPVQKTLSQAAVDLLPGWARDMHGFAHQPARAFAANAAAQVMAHTLRWSFRGV